MKVFVYFNLHKKMFSVKALEGPQKGKVIAHRSEIWLKNVRPIVQPAGRDRVRKEQQKNVHAGVSGEWLPALGINKTHKLDKVEYNPYTTDHFVYMEDRSEYFGSPLALLWQQQLWAIN